jgi:hypothetical protein
MRILVKELADLVPRLEVETLMRSWLSGHEHVDENLAADPTGVERQMQRLIENHYDRLRGVPVRYWQLIEQRVLASWNKMSGRMTAGAAQKTSANRITHDAIRKTAFFIARDFYRTRSIERVMGSTTFERVTLTNTAYKVRRLLLANHDWLIQSGEALQGRRSRRFKLAPDLWPPRRGEAVFYLPP